MEAHAARTNKGPAAGSAPKTGRARTDATGDSETKSGVRNTPSHEPAGPDSSRAQDAEQSTHRPTQPTYGLPLIGDMMARADRLRARLPLGATISKNESELLRAEARALRFMANHLEARAKRLDQLARDGADDERPRMQRLNVE